MGIIQTTSAAELAEQMRADGDEAVRLLNGLAAHYAATKFHIDAVLAHPEADAADRVKIATALREYLAKTDELKAVVLADIAALEAAPTV